MFEITQVLLPYLDVDSMAAWLETCREAHSAFQPVEIKAKNCFNRGLAQRLGLQLKPRWTPNRWKFQFNRPTPNLIAGSAPAAASRLVAQYPDLEAKLDGLFVQHCRLCRFCKYGIKSARVVLTPLADGKFLFSALGVSLTTFYSCEFGRLQLELSKDTF